MCLESVCSKKHVDMGMLVSVINNIQSIQDRELLTHILYAYTIVEDNLCKSFHGHMGYLVSTNMWMCPCLLLLKVIWVLNKNI